MYANINIDPVNARLRDKNAVKNRDLYDQIYTTYDNEKKMVTLTKVKIQRLNINQSGMKGIMVVSLAVLLTRT